MIYLIGLGLHDEEDISLKGLEAAKKCGKVFAEFYTSDLRVDRKNLEKLLGKPVDVLDRKQVEESGTILDEAEKGDVAFLVGGDPLSATTHAELILEARKRKIGIRIVHSSSILTAVAETGLQLYKFGKTTTLPFPKKNYFPESPYDTIAENKKRGLHTLLLLDIGMSTEKGIEVLQLLEEKKKKKLLTDETKIVVMARAGGDDRKIWYDKIGNLSKKDFGKGQHVIIVPGKLHFKEKEFLSP